MPKIGCAGSRIKGFPNLAPRLDSDPGEAGTADASARTVAGAEARGRAEPIGGSWNASAEVMMASARRWRYAPSSSASRTWSAIFSAPRTAAASTTLAELARSYDVSRRTISRLTP